MFVGPISFDVSTKTKVIVYERDSIDVFELIIKADKEQRAIPLEMKAHICQQMLERLRTMHQMGFIHNDVKLENVLFDQVTGEVKLIDFENTEAIEYRNPKSFTRMTGTFSYCYPLLYTQDLRYRMSTSTWTDVYSLVVSFIILLFDFDISSPSLISAKHQAMEREHEDRLKKMKWFDFGCFHTIFTEIVQFDLPLLNKKYKNSFNAIRLLEKNLQTYYRAKEKANKAKCF